MRIKIDKADSIFSKYIRIRDGQCVRCKKLGEGEEGIDGLQNSHYFGRGRESTRFDPLNCDTLCYGCHQTWGSDDKEGYREFKIKQLGIKRFNALRVRAALKGRKDRKLALIIATKLYEQAKNRNLSADVPLGPRV